MEEIHRLTGANPLLLNELVVSAGTSQLSGAGSVRAIMEVRTRSLDPSARAVVRGVALLGQLAHPALGAEVTDVRLEVAEAGLDAAEETGVIVRTETGSYRFAHDLMAEVALSAWSPSESARLHARAAGALEDERGGGAERAVTAARSCLRAATMLVERLAYEAAARLLAEVVELHDETGAWVHPDLVSGAARAELAAGLGNRTRQFTTSHERARVAVRKSLGRVARATLVTGAGPE